MSDPIKLKMVLKNLITNAIKFTERGSVCIAAATANPGVEITVTDTGMGIPDSQLAALFDPFSQAHGADSRRAGGAGLGCADRPHSI